MAYRPHYPTFTLPRIGPSIGLRSPAVRRLVTSATGGLPPLSFPTFPSSGGATDTAGGAPPPGYGDLLSQLLAGLGGMPAGALTPEEGLAQARRALIQYGGVPAGLSGLRNLGGAFDKGTSALANTNTTSGISVLARIGQAHTDQNRYIKNRLAAHGILGSGETGFELGREQTNFARAQADSASKLLDYLTGINSGITSFMQWQAMMDALRGLQQGGGDGGGGAPSPGSGSITQAPHTINYGGYYQPGRGFVQSPYEQSSRGHGTRFIAL